MSPRSKKQHCVIQTRSIVQATTADHDTCASTFKLQRIENNHANMHGGGCCAGVVHGCCAGWCPCNRAWCLVCELCRLAVVCVDCRCSLSFVFLGGSRRLELSPCNTPACISRHAMKDLHLLHANHSVTTDQVNGMQLRYGAPCSVTRSGTGRALVNGPSWPFSVLHGGDRIGPATPRNQNIDQPSRGQDAAQT